MTITIGVIVGCVILLLMLGLAIWGIFNEQGKFNRYSDYVIGVISKLESDIREGKANLTKERGRNKSVEVRTGFIMEKIAPFTEIFGEDPNRAHHMGNPIDYIVFNDDDIVFVEVKTGKARLTPKQNKIKKMVEEGKVSFKTVRFDYE